jgi:tRNA(fMet)-specific endonuclease VapC
MSYLLDTNAVIGLLKDNSSPLSRRTRLHKPADVSISSVLLYELYFGAFRSQLQAQNLARLDALQFEVLSFDAEDARAAGLIRASLTTAGTPIGPYDVLIAGQALARGLVLITNNLKEFARVNGLRVEDWSVARA